MSKLNVVLHTHSTNSIRVTEASGGVLELQPNIQTKGISLRGNAPRQDGLVTLPVIAPVQNERQLIQSLEAAYQRNPSSNSTLVANQEVFVFGECWQHMLKECETLENLFKARLRSYQALLDDGHLQTQSKD